MLYQGCPIIEDPILSALPSYSINLHLGLIPYYKGSITAFWPFYYLEPAMLGTTYHIIDKYVDTGEIIHQMSQPWIMETQCMMLHVRLYYRR